MADAMPDYLVSQQKLKHEIMQLRTRIEGRKLELLELVSRRDNALSNWAAEEVAIKGKEQSLADLAAAHGTVTDELIEEAKTIDLAAMPEEEEE